MYRKMNSGDRLIDIEGCIHYYGSVCGGLKVPQIYLSKKYRKEHQNIYIMVKNSYNKKQREDLGILNYQHLLHMFTTNELGETKGRFFFRVGLYSHSCSNQAIYNINSSIASI